ncbi:MAG: cell division protein FtsL [Pseudomonadota bacterium]
MRGFLLVPAALGVMGLAFWAYQENYRTQAVAAEAAALQTEIGQLRDRLALLEAEWAYLNRPERLRALTILNYDRLGLLPFAPEQFGSIDQVAFPPDPIELIVSGAIEARAIGTGESWP